MENYNFETDMHNEPTSSEDLMRFGSAGDDLKGNQPEEKKSEVTQKEASANGDLKSDEGKKEPQPLDRDQEKYHEPADTTTPEKTAKPEKEEVREKAEDVKEKEKEVAKTEYVAPVEPAAIEKGDYVVDPLAVLYPGTWFNPRNLHPAVADLVYWRDPKVSGGVLGFGLVLLFALAQFSFISVFAYLFLTILIATFVFRVFKSVLQTVQKTGDGHPFKEYLEADVKISQEKARQSADLLVQRVNGTSQYLRHVLLIEDYVDSVKFGVALWALTYVGSWFNGLTLFIIGYVALFTLPKFYEVYQPTIDAYVQLGMTKFEEISSKVRAVVPIGKKKEQ